MDGASVTGSSTSSDCRHARCLSGVGLCARHSVTEDRNGAQPSKELELATLGGGCFWCLEAVYTELRGVERVISGYAGGNVPHPTYEQVCSGRTGHAEVVQVAFDPNELSYRDVLDV